MNLGEFIRITYNRLGSNTPLYFRKWRGWLKGLTATAGAVDGYATTHDHFMSILERMHIVTACQYILLFSLSGVFFSSLPSNDPQSVDPTTSTLNPDPKA